MLKRLDEAQADGDRIWGVIRATALNQDGASPGLTVPSRPAQEKCIEAALARAGIEPARVDYLEAHGTGTPVGDPIELEATAAAYRRGTRSGATPADRLGEDQHRTPGVGGGRRGRHQDDPGDEARGHPEAPALPHPESGDGLGPAAVAGHGRADALAGQRRPSPDRRRERVRVVGHQRACRARRVRRRRRRLGGRELGALGRGRPRGRSPWTHRSRSRPPVAVTTPETSAPPAAATTPETSARSAAGATKESTAQPIAGAMKEWAEQPPSSRDGLGPRESRFLPLSGRSATALRELVGQFLSWLDERAGEIASGDAAADPLLSDMAWTAGTGRSHFDHRAGVVFRDLGSLREGLRALVETDEGAGSRSAAKVAFRLHRTGQPVGRHGRDALSERAGGAGRCWTAATRCCARTGSGASLLDVMFGRPGTAGGLDDPMWKQPAIYALECALTALWSSLGIRPDVLMGHSLGEIAAAHAAGVFSLEEGLRFAAARGSLIGALPGEGAMAAVFAPPSRVASALEEHNATAEGPGPRHRRGQRRAPGGERPGGGHRRDPGALRGRGDPGPAPAQESRLPQRHGGAGARRPGGGARRVHVRSCVDHPGEQPDRPGGGAGHGARRGVLAPAGARAGGVPRLRGDPGGAGRGRGGGDRSPRGTGPMTILAWPESAEGGAPSAVVSSLRRPHPDIPAAETEGAFVAAAAEAYEAGLPIRFEGLFAGEARRRISLPGYPFQRERHWVETTKRRRAAAGHPLLGDRHEVRPREVTFEMEVFPSDPAWLDDHRVFGRLVVPGALYGAMAASASVTEGATGSVALEDMQLHNPLVFPERDTGDGSDEDAGRKVQVLLDASGDGPGRRVQVLSRGESDEEWTLHAEARIPSSPGSRSPEAPSRVDIEAVKAGLSPPGDVPAFYRAKAERRDRPRSVVPHPGAGVVPAGRGAGRGVPPRGAGRERARRAPAPARRLLPGHGGGPQRGRAEGGTTYLPFGWERLWLATGCRTGSSATCACGKARAAVRRTRRAARPRKSRPAICACTDSDGTLVGELNGYTVKSATRAALLAAVEGVRELLYEVAWARPRPAAGHAERRLPDTAGRHRRRFGAVHRVPGGRRRRGGRGPGCPAGGPWSGWRSPTRSRPWTGWAGSAARARSWIPRSCGSAWKSGAEHERLFRRLLEMLARCGVSGRGGRRLHRRGRVRRAVAGRHAPPTPRSSRPGWRRGTRTARTRSACSGAARTPCPTCCAAAWDPLTLLFSSGEPTAADLYMKAPVARAANRMLADAITALLSALPPDRRLRVLEVGAGTGSATAAVLPGAPGGTLRLHLHRHLGRLLLGSGVALRGSGGVHRLPGAGHRERPGGAGVRRPRLRPDHRLKRAPRHSVPRRDPRPLPRAACAVGASWWRWRTCAARGGWT